MCTTTVVFDTNGFQPTREGGSNCISPDNNASRFLLCRADAILRAVAKTDKTPKTTQRRFGLKTLSTRAVVCYSVPLLSTMKQKRQKHAFFVCTKTYDARETKRGRDSHGVCVFESERERDSESKAQAKKERAENGKEGKRPT
eukprot:SAG11_NODE_4822_length_1754_cov_1.030816_4_plen_143_part_00